MQAAGVALCLLLCACRFRSAWMPGWRARSSRRERRSKYALTLRVSSCTVSRSFAAACLFLLCRSAQSLHAAPTHQQPTIAVHSMLNKHPSSISVVRCIHSLCHWTRVSSVLSSQSVFGPFSNQCWFCSARLSFLVVCRLFWSHQQLVSTPSTRVSHAVVTRQMSKPHIMGLQLGTPHIIQLGFQHGSLAVFPQASHKQGFPRRLRFSVCQRALCLTFPHIPLVIQSPSTSVSLK